MTAAVTLKVERVGKLHPPANALPGLRAHQLQLALHDMVVHHFHPGQHLWLHVPNTVSAHSPPAPPLLLPAPVWLLVQAWAHAAVAAGTTRLQLAPSASALLATTLVQPGDVATVQSLTSPLLPATSITLRRLVTDDGGSTDAAWPDDGSTVPSTSGSVFQAAIDSFISVSMLNRPCHVGMTLSVQLFNTTQQLVVDGIEPTTVKADSTSPPAVYVVSAETDITLIQHSAPTSASQPAEDSQTVDFCQCCFSLIMTRHATITLSPCCPLLRPAVRSNVRARPLCTDALLVVSRHWRFGV